MVKSELTNWMNHLLTTLGIKPHVADAWDQAITIAIILAMAVVSTFILRWLLLNVLHRFIQYSKLSRNILLNVKSLKVIAYFAPAAIIYTFIPLAFPPESKFLPWIEKLCIIYVVVIVSLLINAVLKVTFEIFNRREEFRDRPLKGGLQITQVLLFFVAAIVVVSIMIGKSPAKLLTGLGASAAIVMLVFKDSILGFVAGIQLSANHMVRPGDWISMPKYNVDGTVSEITLNTVKVENFDNTITTLPPYALVSDSFQNWRGMEVSGGRRIMRSVNIDVNSVKFCTPEMLERFKQIPYMKDYIEKQQDNSAEAPRTWEKGLPGSERFTNLGLFRAYLLLYIENLPVLNKDLTYMVRHLQPTDTGIPIQLYFFSKVKEWVAYEGIQADVFDHVMAVVREFDLYIFQQPSGDDIHFLATPQPGNKAPAPGKTARKPAAAKGSPAPETDAPLGKQPAQNPDT